MGFAYPSEEHNALPKEWVATYTRRGLMIKDPVIQWVYANDGAARWSEIEDTDSHGVLALARNHGLNYGAAISLCEDQRSGQRSYGSFARSDREFTDCELADLSSRLMHLHIERRPPENLTKAELEALKMVKDGLLMKEVANLLGVTEGAVKQRLKSAKSKLGAKTGTHAATRATTFGLI
ncbi:helix-turn-helix transcriptional regulator [Candidatus Rhodobacter oscarellae]